MRTRREFLGSTLAALWLEPAGAAPRLWRWWPRFPLPREVWVVPLARDMEEGLLLESAPWLAARAALRGERGRPMLYEETSAESYRLAFEAYCAANAPHIVRLTLDEAIARLAEQGVIQGFLLARYDPSPRPLHDEGSFDESMN